MKYYGHWAERVEVAADFEVGSGSRYGRDPFVPAHDFPTDEEILLASYATGSYDGDAFVLFERDGKLYEVHGSHCSCHGLEGQWDPEETNWPALHMRNQGYMLDGHDDLARLHFEDLLATHPMEDYE